MSAAALYIAAKFALPKLQIGHDEIRMLTRSSGKVYSHP
jgi:hypothetical protein